MSNLKKFNLSGKQVGEITVADSLAQAETNQQLIKDYIVALRENARQWSASTKGRSEVKHTTKKPHRQKGTGNARQGSLVAPQYRGGGIVFGPKPKFDQHVRINRKEKRAAIRSLIGEKIRSGHVVVLDDTAMDAPKTKAISAFLSKADMKGRTLFIAEQSIEEISVGDISAKFSMPTDCHANFVKSIRNIPKVSFSSTSNLSGYDVICARNLVITEAGLGQLLEWLCKE